MVKTEKQWSEMTWQERREERFKKWLSTDDINFKNQAAVKGAVTFSRWVQVLINATRTACMP